MHTLSLPEAPKCQAAKVKMNLHSSLGLSTLLLDGLLVLGLDVLDTADHVERVLGHVVVLAVQDLLEGVDGL